MGLFDPDTAEEYLELLGDWTDPWPAPVLVEHEGFMVVRDDLLDAGTKVRGLDYLIGHNPETAHIKEWVFGSCPATGYAQISLPVVCAKYDKSAHLFMAERKMENLHEYQKRGIAEGTVYHWVPSGMLPVTQARAREYAAERDDRMVLPLGLEHPTVTAAMIKVARDIPYTPTEVWTVGSSGSLNRSLQLAWPDAEVHVVSVGHKMSERDIGRAIFHRSPYKFDKPVKPEDAPPYPSVPEYDSKLWPFVRELASPGALIWNVAA